MINTTAKIVEKIVLKQLERHFENIISLNQSGFRRGDSTKWQLYLFVQEKSEAIDRGQLVGITLHHLQEAFDESWHNELLAKLTYMG